jgi:hypothetical protein
LILQQRKKFYRQCKFHDVPSFFMAFPHWMRAHELNHVPVGLPARESSNVDTRTSNLVNKGSISTCNENFMACRVPSFFMVCPHWMQKNELQILNIGTSSTGNENFRRRALLHFYGVPSLHAPALPVAHGENSMQCYPLSGLMVTQNNKSINPVTSEGT